MLNIKSWLRIAIAFILAVTCFFSSINPVWAAIDDDRFDGNIFALYAGNGSLIPPRISLADSLKIQRPSLIAFYIDDSSDCKKFAGVISQLQAYYGKAASFIPITVDSIDPSIKYPQTEAGYYYTGTVPQVVVVDGQGKVRLNAKGQVPFEKIDDVLREVFNLLPRSESVELRKRSFNEFNSELTQ